MKYQLRASIVLICFVIYVACMSKNIGVEATRMLSDDLPQTGDVVRFPIMYKNARETMSYWLQRLASGPSPRGPGH